MPIPRWSYSFGSTRALRNISHGAMAIGLALDAYDIATAGRKDRPRAIQVIHPEIGLRIVRIIRSALNKRCRKLLACSADKPVSPESANLVCRPLFAPQPLLIAPFYSKQLGGELNSLLCSARRKQNGIRVLVTSSVLVTFRVWLLGIQKGAHSKSEHLKSCPS
jgi:hypothetical protein